MGFCSSCGAPNEGGVAFCSSCGAPLKGAVAPNVNQTGYMQAAANQRSESIEEINKMIAHFSKKSNEYKEYDNLISNIPRLQRRKAVALLVWGIIFTIISSIILMLSGGATFGVVLLVIGILMIIGQILINVSRRNRLNESYHRLSIVSEELFNHYNAYGMCLLGPEYTNPEILTRIKETILGGRADTPKEALNVLLDDMHKSNVEALSRVNAVNSAAAARGARASAVFAAASFFLK